MDILKRSLAPITDEAWKAIDEQAARALRGNLSARRVVNVEGPHGIEFGAVNLGRLDVIETRAKGVPWGVRRVQPLVEVRVPFQMSIMELDSISRGLRNPDLDPVSAAAQKTATFEEMAVYKGLSEARILGVAEACAEVHKPLLFPKDPQGLPEVIEAGVVALQKTGVGGPFQLVLGTAPYVAVAQTTSCGTPMRKIVESILGGSIHWSPALEGGVLMSSRGGDFTLTIGQDFSVGFAFSDTKNVELYIAESFTFQVLSPEAAIEFKTKA